MPWCGLSPLVTPVPGSPGSEWLSCLDVSLKPANYAYPGCEWLPMCLGVFQAN